MVRFKWMEDEHGLYTEALRNGLFLSIDIRRIEGDPDKRWVWTGDVPWSEAEGVRTLFLGAEETRQDAKKAAEAAAQRYFAGRLTLIAA